MLVVTSQKLKGATCKRSGKKLVRTRVCTVASGVSAYEVCAFESVVCTASDLLLGDHLNEKSDNVKWVDVSMPHKRSRRLMDHKALLEIAENDPDTGHL